MEALKKRSLLSGLRAALLLSLGHFIVRVAYMWVFIACPSDGALAAVLWPLAYMLLYPLFPLEAHIPLLFASEANAFFLLIAVANSLLWGVGLLLAWVWLKPRLGRLLRRY